MGVVDLITNIDTIRLKGIMPTPEFTAGSVLTLAIASAAACSNTCVLDRARPAAIQADTIFIIVINARIVSGFMMDDSHQYLRTLRDAGTMDRSSRVIMLGSPPSNGKGGHCDECDEVLD